MWSWKIATPLQTGRWGQRRRGRSARPENSQECRLLLLLPLAPPPSSPLLLPLFQTTFPSDPGWAASGNQAAGWPGGGKRWRRKSPWHCRRSPLDLAGGARGKRREKREGEGRRREEKETRRSSAHEGRLKSYCTLAVTA